MKNQKTEAKQRNKVFSVFTFHRTRIYGLKLQKGKAYEVSETL